MTYEFTDDQFQKYAETDDGLDAIKILGVEDARFTGNGLRHDDGTIEKYEDFHVRVGNIQRDGGNLFEL